MKRFHKRVYSLALSLVMALTLAAPAHALIYEYELENGFLRFDASTGTITDCYTALTSVEIPSEVYGVPVTALGDKAFQGCGMLKSIVIPSTVMEIGQGAFSGCRQLTSITIPGTVITLADASDEFSGIFNDCYALESVTITGNIKRVPDYMFKNCENLKEVTLESGIEEIGRYTFYNCKSLESITLPDTIRSIEDRAFYRCASLTTITVGANLRYLGSNAFYETPKLVSIYFRGDAPSTADEMIGYRGYANGIIVYYPEDASGWYTPTWKGCVSRAYTLSTPVSPSVLDPVTVTAAPTRASVLINGQKVSFDAYTIRDNNYFKLRDLAYTLSGTNAKFDVVWSQDLGAVLMTSGKSYTPAGGEMGPGSSIDQTGVLNSSKVYLDGRSIYLAAYTIRGSNYFKLRDIGRLFNFSVEWDSVNQQIVIDTNRPY